MSGEPSVEVHRLADGDAVAMVIGADGHRVLYVTPPGPERACVEVARVWIAQRVEAVR